MQPRPKITLDNNCIINLFDPGAATPTSVDELTEILTLVEEGVAEIAVTTRVESDLENDRDSERRARLMQKVQSLNVVGTVARMGFSRWDSGDVWGGDDTIRLTEEIRQIIFPGGLDPKSKSFGNKINDIDHLVGHKINRRDIFVTDDGAILKKAENLRRSPGILVMKPPECLKYLRDLRRRIVSLPLQSEVSTALYSNNSLTGRVTFNFSNNDGSFVIGYGIFLFEPKWTEAGADSIHVYTDAPSIDSLALAEGVTETSSIRSAEGYDFTSRVRTPREGDVVIVQNKNGYFCAIKIVDVLVKDRGDDRDELVFDFAIQTNGTCDFGTL